MPNLMAGSLAGQLPPPTSDKLEIVSVLVNDGCNLRCRHCYLNAPEKGQPLSPEEWGRFFESLLRDIAPSVLCFAGKEPFLDRTSVAILQQAVILRDRLQPERHTRIGAITNGTLLRRYRDHLARVSPDYFDVSIDGLPEAHDAIRGPGAFRRLAPNLRWLLAAFEPGRVWVTHTVTASTARTLPGLLRFYSSKFGAHHYSVGFYQPTPKGDRQLDLSQEQLLTFVQSIPRSLGRLELPRPVEVVLDLDLKQVALVALLVDHGWLRGTSPIVSTVHRFPNGLTLRVRAATSPVGLWRAVRITPEGHWLAAEDLFHVSEYTKNAAASLRECGLDASRAYRAGLGSRRYRELVRLVRPQGIMQRHDQQQELDDEVPWQEHLGDCGSAGARGLRGLSARA